jgi:hypothetical protein
MADYFQILSNSSFDVIISWLYDSDIKQPISNICDKKTNQYNKDYVSQAIKKFHTRYWKKYFTVYNSMLLPSW